MSDTGRPGIIVDRISVGLRNKLILFEDECYPAAASAYIDGQPPFVIQVIPGAISTEGAGDGSQDGGSLVRRIIITLSFWYRVKLDMHQHSEQALIEAEHGLMDRLEQTRDALVLTNLGSLDPTQPAGTPPVVLSADCLKYLSETVTTWFDYDKGVLHREMNFSGAWGIVEPTSVSMGNADFVTAEIDGGSGQEFVQGGDISGTYDEFGGFVPSGGFIVSADGQFTHQLQTFTAADGEWSGTVAPDEFVGEWKLYVSGVFAGIITVSAGSA